ncbi:hypothetical protein [Streptomyces sp. NPDC056296]
MADVPQVAGGFGGSVTVGSRRIRFTDAWASASYHLDEDDDQP